MIRELLVQLFMVFIAGLDGRLLIPFSLWLGSIVARPTYFDFVFQDVLFLVDLGFFVCEQ